MPNSFIPPYKDLSIALRHHQKLATSPYLMDPKLYYSFIAFHLLLLCCNSNVLAVRIHDAPNRPLLPDVFAGQLSRAPPKLSPDVYHGAFSSEASLYSSAAEPEPPETSWSYGETQAPTLHRPSNYQP
ncbi:hypothetical protein B296_00014977 [Ensete ventricosum]|uniref:Uncharacterized protein n=1 Tax=Ensete ventricosum TaxID=4639 RepID=A0A426Z4X0_ENSVE|nr:hypothetical protein B296_00014977 [Ensete ventricosum]